MNPLLIETFMIMFILAYVALLGTFIFHQMKGKGFLESFDKALASSSIFFIIGYAVDASAYMTVWA